MAEYARRLSALAEAYREGRFGTAAASPGVTLAERRPLDMAQLTAFAGRSAAVREMVRNKLGLDLPEQPNIASVSAANLALWVGPERWLIVSTGGPDAGLEKMLRTALGSGDAAVIDLAQGRTVIRVSGPRTRDLLAKGTGIDLDPRVFPAGACAQTLLGHIGALLHAVQVDAIDVYVARSFAVTFWEWLTEGAVEYGYEVGPATM